MVTHPMAPSDCLFCSIATGSTPAHVVLDEPGVLAFLDLHPVFVGHVLVVPRAHTDHLGTLPPAELPPLFGAVQRVAAAVQAGMAADGTFVAVNNIVSQSVPHLHVHVVPRRRKDGLRGFFWPRQKYSGPQEMEATAEAIRTALKGGEPWT